MLSGAQKSFTDKDVFRYNEYRNVTSLDPAFARNLKYLAYQPNVQWISSADENLEAAYIQRMEDKEDGSICLPFGTISIFMNRKSLDHKEVGKLSADFVYSFNRLTDPELASPGGWVLKM